MVMMVIFRRRSSQMIQYMPTMPVTAGAGLLSLHFSPSRCAQVTVQSMICGRYSAWASVLRL